MDHQSNGNSPSPLGSSQHKARKRPGDSDKDPPSMGSETSLSPLTEPDTTGPGASADGATTSKVVSSLEKSLSTLDKDSESSTEDSLTPRKSPGKYDEHAGPTSLSTMKDLTGHFTGETLDFRLPCTATEGTTCQIIRHLSAWNEFLCLVFWHLQEMPGSSGKLSLALLCEPCWRYVPPQELHLVTLLVCHLLKTHRCVAHVEFDIALFESHHLTLSDAIRGSPSITSLKLTFLYWISSEDLVTAALSHPHLQELELVGCAQLSGTLVAGLSTFLQTTTSLTALKVSHDGPRGLNTEGFFRSLGQNCSLQELVLPSSLIAEAPPSAQAAFAESLMNSKSLKSFTLALHSSVFWPLKCIFKALLGNRSIVAVDLRCPKIDQADVHLMSKIFEQNKVLLSFKISYECEYRSITCSFVQGGPHKDDCDRCLKALLENHSLEEIALPINVWDVDQWKELLEALPAKRNLKRVSIEALDRAPPPFVGKLCAALKETGADQKVSFNASLTEEEFEERFTCKAFRKVVVRARGSNRAAVCGTLECMPSLGHIGLLHLHFDIGCGLDGAPSSALATSLGATRTLKTLTLSASRDALLYGWQEALVDGLMVNTSLKELRINVGETMSDFRVFCEPLADVINSSKNISRVQLVVGLRDFGERAFFRRLSTGVADNYTLLNVTMLGCSYGKFNTYWFKVWDTTRRNYGLLTGAADFARGARRDRHCALALERMHGHPELVEEEARLEKVDQARAAAMVRDGLRSIQGMHAFMRLAGVVKESVSCHAHKDVSTQLDSLNEDCWRALRHYLKLYDIRDSTAEVLPQ